MKVVALSVGLPQIIEWRGEPILTSIVKEQVTGPRRVSRLNIEGDEQSDLTVHGGVNKAVYAYPSEHYPYWCAELGVRSLPWASFGENLTTQGLLENEIQIGDRYRIGSAELVVTQPRMPCFKLNAKFQRADMVKRFYASGFSGFYFSVAVEGTLGAGDDIELVERGAHGVSVADVARHHAGGGGETP